MLIYNFGIKQMEFGDDAFFLKQFTHDFQSNYYEFLKFRYNEWTSRLVIEIVLTQAVQHVFVESFKCYSNVYSGNCPCTTD